MKPPSPIDLHFKAWLHNGSPLGSLIEPSAIVSNRAFLSAGGRAVCGSHHHHHHHYNYDGIIGERMQQKHHRAHVKPTHKLRCCYNIIFPLLPHFLPHTLSPSPGCLSVCLIDRFGRLRAWRWDMNNHPIRHVRNVTIAAALKQPKGNCSIVLRCQFAWRPSRTDLPLDLFVVTCRPRPPIVSPWQSQIVSIRHRWV